MFKPWRWKRAKKVTSTPKESSQPVEAGKNRRRSLSGAREEMRMMSSCIREIQAPISDLCGLRNIVADIPEDSTLYFYAKSMNTCGILLADMIENMRLYYTLSADLYEIDYSSFVLRSELEFVWDSLIEEQERMNTFTENDAERGKIRLNLEFGKDVPAGLVESDSTCVLKIFKSLLDNAIRFTLEGSISVDIFVDTFDPKTKKTVLHFVVADTGVGVPDEAQEAIFGPLTKAHSESIRGGIGMGLPVAKAMCEALGGDLILDESISEDNGSTFHASFPILARNWKAGGVVTHTKFLNLKKKDSASSFFDVEDERSGRVLSAQIDNDIIDEDGVMPEVLLVEDVLLNQTIVSRMMRDVNVTVSIANDGLQAIEACLEKKFDVILMDITMPNMGGLEATHEIKTRCPLNTKTPIIALTGTLAGKMGNNCMKTGMVGCIPKPVQRRLLVETVADNVNHAHRVWMAAENR